MNFRTLTHALLFMMLFLESCVMLPIPVNEDKVLAGKPVTEAQLSFLTPKITTKKEVVEHLGDPNLIWEDARVFVYQWDMRQGILFWAVGAYSTGAAGMTDIKKHYLLLIQFDERNKVLRFSRTTRPLSQSSADFLVEWLKGFPSQCEDRPKQME